MHPRFVEPCKFIARRARIDRSAEIPVDAERTGAGFASWYSIFPRSQSGDPARHGTFDDVVRALRDRAAHDEGFELEEHRLDLYGRCAPCSGGAGARIGHSVTV